MKLFTSSSAPVAASWPRVNEGWIDFERGEAGTVKGKVDFETVLQCLVERAAGGRASLP